MYKFNRGLASRYSAYIKNNRKAEGSAGSVIPLLLSPNSLSETMSANYDQQNVPGHRTPIISFSYTGARQVSLSYTVTADHVPTGYTMSSYIQALKELEYPTYDASIVYAPSCTLVLPNLSLEGVCTSITIDYKTDRILQNGSMSAEVSLSFTEVKDSLNGYVNIQLDGSNDNNATNTSNGGDKKTEDPVIEDKLTIYGEGLTQSAPFKVSFSSSSSWFNYDKRTQETPDNVLNKYTVYGNVTNVRMMGECISCNMQFGTTFDSPGAILSAIGEHLNTYHKGKECTCTVKYYGNIPGSSRGCSGGTRYIKAISKK